MTYESYRILYKVHTGAYLLVPFYVSPLMHPLGGVQLQRRARRTYTITKEHTDSELHVTRRCTLPYHEWLHKPLELRGGEALDAGDG